MTLSRMMAFCTTVLMVLAVAIVTAAAQDGGTDRPATVQDGGVNLPATATRQEGGAGAEEAREVRAPVGGVAVLDCHLDFPFNHEIPYHLQWDKDGTEMYSWYSGDEAAAAAAEAVSAGWRGRVQREEGEGLGDGAVSLSGVRASDAGLYRCRVAFPNRSPPARRPPTYWRLFVDGDDLIVSPPLNATVREGDRVELECTPRDPQANVSWTKDDQPLQVSDRVLVASNGSMIVTTAVAEDAGGYECLVAEDGPTHRAAAVAEDGPTHRAAAVAEDGPTHRAAAVSEDGPTHRAAAVSEDGPTHRAAAYLDVQYPAKVVHAPSERLLPRGQPASLDCHFSANPPLTNLRWEKDGFLFDPYNVPGVFYSRNGSLLFNKVDDDHEGAYSCTPYNALGTAGAAPPVTVRVLRPPEISLRPQPLYVGRLGAAVTMPCVPGGASPAPRVQWAREGAPLPAGRHVVRGGNLTLAPLAADDAGRYRCTISNAAASVSAAAELRLENAPPRAPRRLAARATPTQIHLTWQPATGSDSAEAVYEVWYRVRGASQWRSLRLLSRGAAAATVLGLRPRTAYELRVLQLDQLGDGLFSRPLHVLTPAAAEDEGGGGGGRGVTEAFVSHGTSDMQANVNVNANANVTNTFQNEEDDENASFEQDDDSFEVSLRLVEEGVLVRWPAHPTPNPTPTPTPTGCTLTLTQDRHPLATLTTKHDYALVSGYTEGALLQARVSCPDGRRGAGALSVPAYGRLRAVATGCAAGALVLAGAGAAGAWAVGRYRRRL